MTQEIALLMVGSAACAFGHLLPGPYLYLRLTLMRTFLLPSPDYRVVMTHAGRLGRTWRSRAEFFGGTKGGCWGRASEMNLLIMEKKRYIARMTVSIRSLQRSSSPWGNNQGSDGVIKWDREGHQVHPKRQVIKLFPNVYVHTLGGYFSLWLKHICQECFHPHLKYMLFPVYRESNKIPLSQVAAEVFQPEWHWAPSIGWCKGPSKS